MPNIKGMERVKRALGQLASEATLKGVMKVAGETVVSKTRERFATETDPDGRKWKQSKRARRQRGKTLTDTARLRNSFNYRVTSTTSVSVGTNVSHGIFHQKPTRHAARQHTLNFRVNRRTGRSRFSRASRANFSQTVNVRAYTTPPRKMLPETHLPPSYQRALTGAFDAYLRTVIPTS